MIIFLLDFFIFNLFKKKFFFLGIKKNSNDLKKILICQQMLQ